MIDAAAQVLAASKEPLTTKQVVEAMTAKALWTSPGGKRSFSDRSRNLAHSTTF